MKSYNEWKNEKLDEIAPATDVDQMAGQPVGNMMQRAMPQRPGDGNQPTNKMNQPNQPKQLGDVARVTGKMDRNKLIQSLASKINNRIELTQFLTYVLDMTPVAQNVKAAALRQLLAAKDPQSVV